MKKLFFLSLAFNIFLILFWLGKRYYYSNQGEAFISVDSASLEFTRTRLDLLSDLPVSDTDFVFIGTSITQNFPVSDIFGPMFKNRGVGGSLCKDVLRNTASVMKSDPRGVVIEAGINDILKSVPKDSILHSIDSILATASKTRTCFISITPVSKGHCNKNKEIIRLNKEIKKLTQKYRCDFLNVTDTLMDNGCLNDNYTYDGIHLNKTGYAAYEEKIRENWIAFQ